MDTLVEAKPKTLVEIRDGLLKSNEFKTTMENHLAYVNGVLDFYNEVYNEVKRSNDNGR